MSESEFTEFENFQNNGNDLFIFSLAFWFSFCKFNNSVNSDSDKIFDDYFHLTLEIQHVNNEERWLTIGQISNIYLIVVHTYYQDDLFNEYIRIISARQATKLEKSRYVENYRRTIR